ncbi:MAG: aspartate ammonia-lyase, partial [Thalassolituus sp.]
MTNAFRTERDSMGEVQVPADALYGAQTQRAVDNFMVAGQPMPEAFVRSLLILKKAAAVANLAVGSLADEKSSAIVT